MEGGYTYVDQALAWGQQYGIGVLIELHAAYGSQNGQDNSAPKTANVVGWNGAQPNPTYGLTGSHVDLYSASEPADVCDSKT